jgi:hypothetical protein
VPRTIIVPFLNIAVPIDQAITTLAIDLAMSPITKSSRKALDHASGLCAYSTAYGIELISDIFIWVVLYLLELTAKNSDIGYILWSFAILLKCRPSLISWLRLSVRTICYEIAIRGNTNGLWIQFTDVKVPSFKLR